MGVAIPCWRRSQFPTNSIFNAEKKMSQYHTGFSLRNFEGGLKTVSGYLKLCVYLNTPQPLYNTIVGVQYNFRVSYPISFITRVNYIDI